MTNQPLYIHFNVICVFSHVLLTYGFIRSEIGKTGVDLPTQNILCLHKTSHSHYYALIYLPFECQRPIEPAHML